MVKKDFNYNKICKLEEKILTKRWEIIRKSINHSGEKGFAAEKEIHDILRSILPNEYGITTGFIAYKDNKEDPPKISKQLDLIIYDALKCSPLIRLGTCDVVPIEGVYAYVEIKGCLYNNEIKGILEETNRLRSITHRYYYEIDGPTTSKLREYGNKNETAFPIRAYIICLTAESTLNYEKIKENLENYSSKIKGNVFISGMLVGNCGYFYSYSVDTNKQNDISNQYKIYAIKDNGFLQFKNRILVDLSRFFRIPQNLTIALDLYANKQGPDNTNCASAPTIITGK
ncbi:MAG: hypothetical protein BWX81_00401 [Spirochaetes bacterium ADurb.Bin110]|jgi:hypothetical protein|nr:MAG: hypothetical protein BWX81_00401 [Spirochaetes bacterium ADurb.Bin110]HNV36290.1 hypothetical protein [Rectinema sp.]HOC78682.1 hypothetical protein [Methanofastidiosum sp.]HPM03554.1 hypothetical protein [Candidatus Cloacimonadota bacterium]